MPLVLSSSGKACTLIGDQLYLGEEATEDDYAGECWEVSDGYQFEMLNDDYTFVISNELDGEHVTMEVSYMENGYYEAAQEYEIEDVGGTYELNVSNSGQKTMELSTQEGEILEPVSVADEAGLQILNME